MLPILWLVLGLAGLQVRPAARPDAGLSPASIQGVVVRSGAVAGASRQQLPDARVELIPGNLSVFTGPDGAFTFRNLAAGRYLISITHDGFVPQEGGVRGLTLSGLSVTLAGGQALKDIVLPMIPGPVIRGTVVDPQGQPLAAALVQAYTRLYTPYGTHLRIVKKAMTNDLGEFRLFGLNFGEFFVSAGYGDRDRETAIGKTQLSANVSKADDGYATIFYDGSEDISQAQGARLRPGSEAGSLNIYLRDPVRFKIRGQVLPPAADTMIALAPKGSDLTAAAFSTQPNMRGAFEIRGVSPGSYVLLATAKGGVLASNVIAVNVTDSDIDRVPLTLEQTASISGRLSVEGNSIPDLTILRVKLVRSSVEFDQRIEVPVNPDGTFTLEHVAPSAEYDVVVDPLPPGTYVKSVHSGSLDILSGRSRIRPDQPLQIALAAATDSFKVHVTKGRNPAAGVRVVLIPNLLLRRRADRYVTDLTGDDGDLCFPAIPPGEYTAYAFEQIEPGAYYVFAYNPAAENRFRDHSISVTISPNCTKATPLSVIPAEETAGGLQ